MLLLLLALLQTPPAWRTPFENDPARNTTATHAQAIAFYQRLAAAYPATVRIQEAGPTDCGQPLHEVVLSADGAADPATARRLGRRVVLLQNGIHPGEPEGIDASLVLARDLAQRPRLARLLAGTTLVIIPAYNVDGMLARGAPTRANQHGPAAYGFRGNARHLDLNRDYVKQDSRNARSFAALFQRWRPDVLVDTHTSNGADYQYTLTLLATQPDKLAPPLRDYFRQSLLPALYAGMAQRQQPITPYVDFAGETPASGLLGFDDSPRYSTGYAALFNCVGMMTETHMLKAYGPRVQATYDFLLTLLETVRQQREPLAAARAAADAHARRQTQFPLAWEPDPTPSDTLAFRGYASSHRPSEVSGQPRLFYDRARPTTQRLPYFGRFRPSLQAQAPAAYLIPQAWPEVADNLARNGVALRRLTRDTLLPGRHLYLDDYQTTTRPFEGHYLHHHLRLRAQPDTLHARAGDYLARTGPAQPAARYLVETLDPRAPDSFFSWGWFDSVLQQKEHYSAYVFEDLAAALLRERPALRQQLNAAKAADPKLVNDADAQLEWVYQHSPYREPAYLRYPVFEVTPAPLR